MEAFPDDLPARSHRLCGFALSSVFCLVAQGHNLTTICQQMVKGISSFSLMAVPFFITMGCLMGSGGISEKLIALANAAWAGCAAAWQWSTSLLPTSSAVFPVLHLQIQLLRFHPDPYDG